MKSPTEAGQGVRLLQPRRQDIPSICYDTCNNAYIEAQSVGKSPELCGADSAFRGYYNACSHCVTDTVAGKDYLDSSFGPWLDYCDSSITSFAFPTTTSSPSLVGATVFVTIPYTAMVNGLQTAFSLTKTLISFAPVPDITVIVIEASQDGHRVFWSFTKTFTHLNDSLISTSQNTSSSITLQETSKATPQTPEAGSDNTQRSQAWVAGPVIGGVAGITILILVIWLLFYIRRKSLRRKAKELHGESVPKSELEAKVPPQELKGQEGGRRPVELPNNNPQKWRKRPVPHGEKETIYGGRLHSG